MNLSRQDRGFEEFANATVTVEDRRIQDRLKLMKTIHISGFDPPLTQDTATVVDISREGLYFTVRSHHYRVGMQLRVAIPSLEFEGVCRVVRIEELPSGCLGIGTLILG
jgi:hypothetical protein